MNYDFNLLYYINIYKKIWKAIIMVMIVSAVLTFVFVSVQPVSYVSTVTLLSTEITQPQQFTEGIGKFLGISGFAANSSSDIVITLLSSRRMSADIRREFDLDKKPGFRHKLETTKMQNGIYVNVNGTDPLLTEKIANFAVVNLDKINTELSLTPNKPMIKILDPAVYGAKESKQIPRKMLIACIMSFLIISLYAFFSDYLKKLKSQ